MSYQKSLARPPFEAPANFDTSTDRHFVVAVVPAFRAHETIAEVVGNALGYVHHVIVVDDGCPERTGEAVLEAFIDEPRVEVIFRQVNGGVGAAVKSGIDRAIELDATHLIKLDADGQMDAAYIPSILAMFSFDPTLVFVKGNRFFDGSVTRTMPKARFFGNAALSLLVKFSSGYWNLLDPTNGYIAFNMRFLRELDWRSFADTYFFEISVLSMLGLAGAHIAELDMHALYRGERSSLSIRRVLWEFPPRLLRLFIRRILLQYFVFDINLGSLYLLFGTFLTMFAVIFGGFQWVETGATHQPRTTGTVMLAVLPFLMGFQLLLNALMYDVQFAAVASRSGASRISPNALPVRRSQPRRT